MINTTNPLILGEESAMLSELIRISISSGLPVTNLLSELSKNFENKKLASWSTIISERIASGNSLEKAIQDVDGIDPLLKALLSVPNGRGLASVLAAYSRYLMLSKTIYDHLWSALFYPYLVSLLALINYILVNYHLFPAIEIIFSMNNSSMPTVMRLLFVANPETWPLSIFSFLLFLFFPIFMSYILIFKSPYTIAESKIAPLLGLSYFSNTENKARIYETIALFLEGGLPLAQSIREASKHQRNSTVFQEMNRVANSIENGADIAQTFKMSKFFSTLCNFIANQSQEKIFIQLFRRVAKRELEYAQKTPKIIEQVSSITSLLLIGILVLILGISFFAPYSQCIGTIW